MKDRMTAKVLCGALHPITAEHRVQLAVEVSAVFINGLAAQSLKLKAGFFIDMLRAEVVFKYLKLHTVQIEIFKRMPEHLSYGKTPRTMQPILAPADYYGKLRTARKAVYADKTDKADKLAVLCNDRTADSACAVSHIIIIPARYVSALM